MPADKPKAPASKPHKRTQLERREQAEHRLLKSALELTARKGVNGMTMSEVGELAGYSRGLPAHHFGSKGKLLQALTEFIRTRFRESQNRMRERKDGLDALLGAIDVYLIGNLVDDQSSRALSSMFAEALVSGGELQQDMQNFSRGSLRFFEEQIAAGIANGEIRDDIDPAIHAVLTLGALRGVINHYLLDPDALDLRIVREAMIGSLRRSLAK